jgi:tRNA G18 (ribose-2'-O)-methylase SpoU
MKSMRGYFGVGLEQSSKPMNAGNLFRTAHAFGASFLFTVNAEYSVNNAKSDTSVAPRNVPWYDYSSAEDLKLPGGCALVGVEFLEDAVELPVFRHPPNAAYILGPEMGNLSPEILERCQHVVKIPTSFCLNVATTGAIILYDRFRTLGNFGERPVSVTGKPLPPLKHVQGNPIRRKQKN